MAQSAESAKFLSIEQPYLDSSDITGKLIVIEGTDGVGRTTQIEDIKRWLEVQGYGVITTGWTRSPLIGKTIEVVVEGYHPESNLLMRGRYFGQCPDIDGMVIINDGRKVKAFGNRYSVQITDVTDYDLIGRVI